MTRVWSFYDATTGEFTGRTFSGPADALGMNTPAGLVAIEGAHHWQTTRVNLQTLQVETWRDPPPSPDHEWDRSAAAWVLSARVRRREALARIHNLEAAQPRALREIAIADAAGAAQARARLQRIDDEIAQLRAVLAGLD